MVLTRKENDIQKPVYFISRTLQRAELRYQQLEKVALALISVPRKLKPYFQSHSIIVQTDVPIRQIIHKPNLARRMVTWAIELSEYALAYEHRKVIKAQALVDFVVEMNKLEDTVTAWQEWTLYVDGSSNGKGSGAGVILEGPNDITLEYSLKFDFQATNNQAKYKALVAGLRLAKEVGAETLSIKSDFQLVIAQIKGDYEVKKPLMAKYA